MREPILCTLDDLPSLNLPSDLRDEATKALEAGAKVELYMGDWRGFGVTTLVVDGYRAGQATNASAVWGDWDGETQTVRLDTDMRVNLDAEDVDEAKCAEE